jgi:hypothetical protein
MARNLVLSFLAMNLNQFCDSQKSTRQNQTSCSGAEVFMRWCKGFRDCFLELDYLNNLLAI